MRKLALSDEILLSISSPARYIGNEINAVMKDKSEVAVRFAMCFPDVYEIGMSHLGIQILYDMFNQRDDIWCERVYSPWPDMDKVMRDKKIPLFALESQEPVKDFDFLGITIQYEMCYTNILQILDLSGIPLEAKERTWDDPIVIGGGPCSYNPEPLAQFFDIFYIGEGETVYFQLIDLYKEERAKGSSRMEFLKKAGHRSLESMYRCCMKLLIKKTEPLLLSLRLTHLFLHLWKNRLSWTLPILIIRVHLLYHLSKRHRIVWFWRSSVAVSADAVSVRQVCSTVRPVNVMWRFLKIRKQWKCWTPAVTKRFL